MPIANVSDEGTLKTGISREGVKDISNSDQQKVMIFFVQGGAGDVLAHTPAIRYWRKQYPQDKLVVLSTYSQLWDNNPHVDQIYPLSDPEDIFDQHKGKIRFFKKHFVYDHILDVPGLSSLNLPDFICRAYNAEFDGESLDYFPKPRELRIAKTFLSQYKKPVILLHLIGSIPSESTQPQKVHTHKDINFDDVKPIIEKYKDRYDFVQIGLLGEPLIPGVIPGPSGVSGLGMPMREAVALIPQCKTFIFIESLFAHCANAVHKTGVVVFNNTNDKFFGYTSNINVAYSGGCQDWPCNRPLGALMDLQAGYFDPKTRARPLWTCPEQRCSRTPPEMIENALLEAIKRNDVISSSAQKPAESLREARAR